ncbi:SPARK domain-containing protein [Psidium guajava]|nr:SPARK domain-containing protein [Psidium guajava]
MAPLLSLQIPATDPTFSPLIHEQSTLKLHWPDLGGTQKQGLGRFRQNKTLLRSFHMRQRILARSAGRGRVDLESQSTKRCSSVSGDWRYTEHRGSGASFLLNKLSLVGKAF